MSAALKKSTPGKFACTCHFQQIGINATKIEKTGIHFKTNVFVAVAVVDAKAPYSGSNYSDTVRETIKTRSMETISAQPDSSPGIQMANSVIYKAGYGVSFWYKR